MTLRMLQRKVGWRNLSIGDGARPGRTVTVTVPEMINCYGNIESAQLEFLTFSDDLAMRKL